MTTQVTAVRLAASGSVLGQPGRVRAIWISDSATAGSIVLKDGGSSGTTVCQIDTPASAAFGEYLKLPGLGLKFNTNIYCTLTNVAAVTLFIG